MASNALVTRSHTEDVTIASQVERVVLTTGDGKQSANIFMLLGTGQ